eukprot:SAG11_NODE_6897_length_1229_cov_1.943363_1_plen_30_part_10
MHICAPNRIITVENPYRIITIENPYRIITH